MRKVTCYECKKRYDYDEDGFCPACGAFNVPASSARIDADGNVVWQEGNDQTDWRSTVQLEQPEEEVDQLWGKLQQSFKAGDLRKWQRKSLTTPIAGRQTQKMGIKQVLWLFVGFIILLNVLSFAF